MFRKLSLVLVSLLVVYSSGVMALGLGEIKLNSGLNQPLKAEITLFSPEGLSEFEVAASLASSGEFQKANIDFLTALKKIRFKTVSRSGDKLVIELSTREPVKEPFLNFLVELNWPKGRMLREYTVFLDPPVFDSTSSSTMTQAEASTEKKSQSSNQTSSQSQYRPPAKQTTSSFSGNSYGPVSENETLWRIATHVKPSGASIHQTLVALYRANPHAFVDNDINLLKKGAVLNVPDSGSISAIPHRAALQDVVTRTRSQVRDSILDASGRESTEVTSTSASDRLKLSTPSSSKTSVDGSGTSLSNEASTEIKNQLSQIREANATLESENEQLRRELQDALAKIEKIQESAINIESAEGTLLANKNDNDIQDSNILVNPAESDESLSGDSDTNLTEANVANNESDLVIDSSIEEAVESNNTLIDPVDDSSTTVIPEDTASTDDSSTTDPDSSDTSSSSVSLPGVNSNNSIPLPVEEDSIFDNSMLLYVGLGGIVLVGGAFLLFWRMRKRMAGDEYQDDLFISAQKASFDTEESLDMPDVGDELLDDIDSDDLFDEDSESDADPIGEADIYIAYGKYEQAEKLLKEAIEKHADRNDLKVKLLECYSTTGNKDAFDSNLSEFSDDFANDAESNEQVKMMISLAWPGDNTVQDEFELPSTEEIFGDDDMSADLIEDDVELASFSDDTEIDEPIAEEQLAEDEMSFDTEEFDFDLDAELEKEGLSASEEDATEELSLDDIDSELPELEEEVHSDAAASTEKAEVDEEFSLDGELDDEFSIDDDEFSLGDDLELSDSASPDSGSIEIEASSEEEISLTDDDLDIDLSDDFDLDEGESDFDDDFMEGADEAATKLDLARAYIDMGDSEGAKEILNEVLDEGNEGHKQEALKLIEKIGA